MCKCLMVMCAMALAVSPVLADDLAPQKLSDVANAPVTPPAEEASYVGGPIVTGGLTWYKDKGEFEANAGKQICLEDLEESTLPPNQVLGIPDPLCSGVPNTNYPNGLEGCDDMCIQSNLGGGNPEKPNPRGANAIALASVGFLGATSDIVLANTFVDSLDMMLDRDDVTGVGANTNDAVGAQQGVDIRVYDVDNNLLGQQHFAANIQGTNFMGVISDGAAIGRINTFSPGNGAEGLDNIQLHAGGGEDACVYVLKRSKPKKCEECPAKGSEYATENKCQDVKDCAKKFKAKIPCPDPNGKKCKLKGKKPACK